MELKKNTAYKEKIARQNSAAPTLQVGKYYQTEQNSINRAYRYNKSSGYRVPTKVYYGPSNVNFVIAKTYYTYEYGPEKTTFTYGGLDSGWILVQQDISSSSYDYLFNSPNLHVYCALTSEDALFCCPAPVSSIDRDNYLGFKIDGSFGDPNLWNDPNGHPQIYMYSEDNLVQSTNLSNSTKTLIANVLSGDNYIRVNTIDHIFVGQYLKFQGQSYDDVDYTTTVRFIYGHNVYLNSPNNNNISVNATSGQSVTFFFYQM